MWEWLNTAVRELVRLYRISSSLGDKDDISQEVLMYLSKDISLAEKIFEEKNKCLLYTIIKKIIFTKALLLICISPIFWYITTTDIIIRIIKLLTASQLFFKS